MKKEEEIKMMNEGDFSLLLVVVLFNEVSGSTLFLYNVLGKNEREISSTSRFVYICQCQS